MTEQKQEQKQDDHAKPQPAPGDEHNEAVKRENNKAGQPGPQPVSINEPPDGVPKNPGAEEQEHAPAPEHATPAPKDPHEHGPQDQLKDSYEAQQHAAAQPATATAPADPHAPPPPPPNKHEDDEEEHEHGHTGRHGGERRPTGRR